MGKKAKQLKVSTIQNKNIQMKLYMLLFQIPLSFMLTCNTKPSSKTTTSLHMCTDLYVNGHACVCVCVHVSICLSAYLSIHLSLSVYVCPCVCS